MKPLSTIKYFKENKLNFISSILVIVLAITLVYSISTYLRSMEKTSYHFSKEIVDKVIFVMKGEENLPSSFINEIIYLDGVEKVLPLDVVYIPYSTVGNNTSISAIKISEGNMRFLMDKVNVTLEKGRLPMDDKKELAMDKRTMINNNLELGDMYDNEYKIVGILDGEDVLNIASIDTNILEEDIYKESIMVIPYEDKYEDVANKLNEMAGDKYRVNDINQFNREFNNTVGPMYTIFNLLSLIIISINVVTLACTKYAQFLNRKSEYGILNSIGYSKRELIISSLKEVLLVNIIGTVIGFIIAYLVSYFLIHISFINTGGLGVYITEKSIVYGLLVPVFTTIFTIIPIFKNLNYFQGINIIEEE